MNKILYLILYCTILWHFDSMVISEIYEHRYNIMEVMGLK